MKTNPPVCPLDPIWKGPIVSLDFLQKRKKYIYNLKLFFNYIKVELNLYYHLYNWETVTTRLCKTLKY